MLCGNTVRNFIDASVRVEHHNRHVKSFFQMKGILQYKPSISSQRNVALKLFLWHKGYVQ
jgi:menaquinone-dependent protoporphyrinogen IX oxidase